MLTTGKEIRKYVRSADGSIQGLLLGQKVYGATAVVIGWSKKHPKDRFNKELAYRIASGRIEKSIERGDYLDFIDTPLYNSKLFRDFAIESEAFVKRCGSYFQSDNVWYAGPYSSILDDANIPDVREPAAIARIAQLIEVE